MRDIFLIVPPDVDPGLVLPQLDRLSPQAVLLERGDDYAARVAGLRGPVQSGGAALLITGTPDEVAKLGADGLHVTGNAGIVDAALQALKPRFIVGAGPIRSKDDAMTFGERGIDYVFFGPISGAIDERTRELARFWSENMEVPSVFYDPAATDPTGDAEGCEFLALGRALWS